MNDQEPTGDHSPELPRRGFMRTAGIASAGLLGAACTDASSDSADPSNTAGSAAGSVGEPVSRPANWPEPQAWEELNRRTNGRLIRPVSPLWPCTDDPGSEACDQALESMKNPFFIEDSAGAAQSTGWMDAWSYDVSPYAVAAESASDIAAAVDFARDNSVRLAVKGAGHDYLGRNTAPDSLLVWTHQMRNINLHDDFVPEGAPAGTEAVTALSVGAGTRWLEAYAAATAKGWYVQGGGCTSVGASGGFIQGSGFGSYSKAFGTGAGGVLEFEVVTADGHVQVVNRFQDPDLFWALRGGGGGTFGIVSRTTVLAHPIPSTTGTVSGKVVASDDDAYAELVRAVVDFYPVALNNPSWGEQIRFSGDRTVEFALTFLDINAAQADATWAALIDPLRGDSRYTVEFSVLEIPFEHVWDVSWWEQNDPDFVVLDPRPNQPDIRYWWAGNQGEVGSFWFAYESRWVPLSMLTDTPDEMVRMLVEASGIRSFIFQINKGLAGASPEALERDRDTALHPSAFEAAGLIIMAAAQQYAYPGVDGHEPDLDEGAAERDKAERAMAIVREALPDEGAYANEASYFTEDWKEQFWGDNYDRLLEVKRRVDPQNLFRVHHGVGSDT